MQGIFPRIALWAKEDYLVVSTEESLSFAKCIEAERYSMLL